METENKERKLLLVLKQKDLILQLEYMIIINLLDYEPKIGEWYIRTINGNSPFMFMGYF